MVITPVQKFGAQYHCKLRDLTPQNLLQLIAFGKLTKKSKKKNSLIVMMTQASIQQVKEKMNWKVPGLKVEKGKTLFGLATVRSRKRRIM